jgi:hypothetical protein
MQTITEWEAEHKKPYPEWAAVWAYDGYGECWESCLWYEKKNYFEKERNQVRGNAAWDFQFEPMVCLPTDEKPMWGDSGVPLKRTAQPPAPKAKE